MSDMKRIQSFSVDHDKLEKGMYISRLDGDVITYDLRFVKPNVPPFLENDGLHTIEHLFATYVRNSKYTDEIIYFGPMGCRTGFYFLTRTSMSKMDAINLVKDTLKYIINFTGDIPGAKKKECGNYLDHNLDKAKKYAKDYLEVIKDITVDDINY